MKYVENTDQEGYDWLLTMDDDSNVKCSADECPYEENCRRKTMQSLANTEWFDFSYKCNVDSGFDSYIEDTDKIIKRRCQK